MSFKLKLDGNPESNAGALFLKPNPKNPNDDYFLMKLTVDKPGNLTFVCFRNPEKDFNSEENMFDKKPAYFIFPYRPKNKENNKNGNNL